ncbi:uncharacterized protein LOC119573760 [Penaeus monodon]|uniref:uncharacterized protein LOC119573760 n=1 Tax=Penaeus monodon TaxID=6687 RepID=UPI0018A736D1|nr:uncharacterized protein LOC119573760 [Penaeus monodon]
MIFLFFIALAGGNAIGHQPERGIASCLRTTVLIDTSCPCNETWCHEVEKEIAGHTAKNMTAFCIPTYDAGLCYFMFTRQTSSQEKCGCCIIETRMLCSSSSTGSNTAEDFTFGGLREVQEGLACGEHNIASPRYFTSPGFPLEKYPNKYYCWRRFRAWAPDYTIQVDCAMIHLRKDKNCRADFLQFNDGYNLEERLCGLVYNVTKVSETGKMDVLFDTNRRKKQVGFNCTVTAIELPCPEPFVKVGSECFHLSHSERVFDEARAFCLGLGGDLASPADVLGLRDYVIDKGQTLAVWVGASDRDIEGSWQWFDGSPIKAEDWYWNAPNNGFGLEHCMVLRPDFDPPLNDAECDRLKKFVCEYDLLKG